MRPVHRRTTVALPHLWRAAPNPSVLLSGPARPMWWRSEASCNLVTRASAVLGRSSSPRHVGFTHRCRRWGAPYATEMVRCSSPFFRSFVLSFFLSLSLSTYPMLFGGLSAHYVETLHVVMLIKNSLKSSTALSNNRPISHDKVYARMLRNRLLPFVEPWLRSTQFGFRAGRSTSQPIHIVRQLTQA